MAPYRGVIKQPLEVVVLTEANALQCMIKSDVFRSVLLQRRQGVFRHGLRRWNQSESRKTSGRNDVCFMDAVWLPASVQAAGHEKGSICRQEEAVGSYSGAVH